MSRRAERLMRAPERGTRAIHLNVAELQLALDPGGTAMEMAIPPSHARFLVGPGGSSLSLTVGHGGRRRSSSWRPLHTSDEAWQLWQDSHGQYFLEAGRHAPEPRQVIFDAAFRSGEVLVPPGSGAGRSALPYPLQGLDMILYANWLAESGDVILHASGIEVAGRGHAFAGPSGAGKSTLAAAFAGHSCATLLGEDNLVLRHLDGRFHLFGTPWHLNHALCLPLRAPLEALYFVDRAGPEGVRPCSPREGISRLLQTAFIPYYRPDAVARILDRLIVLAEHVPFRLVHYRLGTDPMTIIEA